MALNSKQEDEESDPSTIQDKLLDADYMIELLSRISENIT